MWSSRSLLPALTAFALSTPSARAQEEDPALLAFPGRLDEVLALDLDGDGNEELVLLGLGDASAPWGAHRRGLRVWSGLGTKSATPRADDSAVPESWCAIAFGEWSAAPGLELVSLDAYGARWHPRVPHEREGASRFAWHPQGRTLLEAETFFGTADLQRLWIWPGARRGSRGEELLVPLPAGYRSVRREPGREPVLGASYDLAERIAARRVYDASPFRTERELPLPVWVDLDGDGSDEVAFESASDRRILAFAAPGDHPAAIEAGERAARAEEARVEKLFRRLVDVNGDRRADLLSWSVRGDAKKGFSFETTLVLRLAEAGELGSFGAERVRAFKGAGTVLDTPDLDGDGHAELWLARCENPAAAALGGIATVRYALYFARGAEGWPSQPELETTLRIPLAVLTEAELRAGRLPAYARLDADLDGDGVPDLLRILPGEGLEVQRGHLEERRLEGRSWRTFRLEERPWFAVDAEVGAACGPLRRGGRIHSLWYAAPGGVRIAELPDGD